jgi:hypothetical protein
MQAHRLDGSKNGPEPATNDGRNPDGTFGAGNGFGKGRPRRQVEREYLATLSAVVTPEVWESICQRAAADAMAGDHRAREWIGRIVLGTEPMRLLDLAADESDGFGADAEIIEQSKHRKETRFIKTLQDMMRETDTRTGASR